MPENSITHIRTNGLGRRDPSLDHVSALLLYNNTLPSGFAANDRVKAIFSVQEAEDLGIVDTHTDETPAGSGAVLITAAGATATVSSITIDGVLLGAYTVQDSDAVGDVASGLVDAVNALTLVHGFVATLSTATVLLTPPAELGIVPNGATIAFSNTGIGAGTVTQFSAGVGSEFAVMHYHISEFFRMKPNGKLWVGIYAVETFDGGEITLMRAIANGEFRQIAVYLTNASFATSQLAIMQTEMLAARTAKQQCFGVFHADCSELTLSTLSNLATLTYSKVQTVIGEDGNFHQADYSASKAYIAGDKCKWLNKTYVAIKSSTGQAPYDTDYFGEVSLNLPDIVGHSVSSLGTQLGCWAKAKVNENTANPERFPLTDGDNHGEAGFATGDLYKNLSQGLRDQLNDYHYTYLRNFSGDGGVYFNDTYTAIASSDDYATGENNRTMDKSERNTYVKLIPKVAGDINLNSDGTLSQTTINDYHTIVAGELDLMMIDGEISGTSDDKGYEVTIDQSQNVLSTSEVKIAYKMIPKAKGRRIVLNNSYAVKL